jgi:hypothetical protein
MVATFMNHILIRANCQDTDTGKAGLIGIKLASFFFCKADLT